MYPEAGGSSSFARHAFNEFWSFFAAWGQMLNYVITVAISAFFVPHYIGGLFWEPLRSSPADIICGAIIVMLLAAINVRGAKESAGLNIALAVTDFMTQLLLVVVGIALVLNVDTLTANVHFGVAPTWSDFLLAIPIGMVAYTGIETISNLAEEAKDEATTIPAAISRVRLAVFAIYFTLPAVALSALPVTLNAKTGEYQTLLGLPRGPGRLRGRPDPRRGQGVQPRLTAASRRDLRRPARRDDPLHRDERRPHRRVAPGLLDGHPPPGARPPRRLHPKYGTPWIGILVFGGVAIVTLHPRPGRLPREHVRLRRDAVVHDRAHLGHPAAQDQSRRGAAVHRPRQPAVPRLLAAAVRRVRRHRHRDLVRRGHGAEPGRRAAPASSGWRSASACTSSTAATRAWTS